VARGSSFEITLQLLGVGLNMLLLEIRMTSQILCPGSPVANFFA